MPFKPSIHPFGRPPQGRRRRSIRLRGYDYAAPGAYFVTIDTHRMKYLFGKIVNGVMRLNEYGEIARAEWLKTAFLRPEIVLDEFQIMPNYIHAIIHIMDCGAPVAPVGAHGNAPDSAHGNAPDSAHGNAPIATPESNGGGIGGAHGRAPLRRSARSLGTLIGGFKSAVTIRINRIRRTPGAKLWQRNYHDHIIRNSGELSRIRKYIRDNPMRWGMDIKNQ
jgi:putative transposase